MNINVSVIIPVYNAEKYLRECLKSLLNQTLSDIEIILSNDGSTDGSIPSIQDLIDSNAHIKLLENINQGAAIARNKGLEIAQGKYISFVDADDIVKPDFLKELFQACEKDDLDLVCGSFEAIHGDGRQNLMPRNKEVLELGVSNGAELFKLQILLHNYIPMIWAYLYRREFLLENNLYLTRNTIHEDEEFSPRVWVLAKKARVIENYNYIYYRNHENSIIESRSNASIADLENSLQGFLEFQENLEFYQKQAFAYGMLYLLDHYVYYSRMTKQINKKLIKNVWSVLIANKVLTGRQKFKYRLIMLNTNLYYLLQKYER
ncbi:MAG: glycosyltransferase [Streptococcaceae bacterium]|nr:glycosyltransferase [Streptococcaceae bacterium]